MNFKYTLTTLAFILLLSMAALSQNQSKSKIFGTAIDKETKLPLEFVNVSLHHANDSTLVIGTVTGQDGNYNLTNIAPGKYFVQLNLMGFEPAFTQGITLNSQKEINMGTTEMEVSNIFVGRCVCGAAAKHPQQFH